MRGVSLAPRGSHGSLTPRRRLALVRRLALAAFAVAARARAARRAGGTAGGSRRLRRSRHLGRHLRRARVPQPRRDGGADRSARRPDGVRRDGERPQHRGRRQPEGARAVRRRAAETRASVSSAGTCPASSSPRSTSAAPARCSPSGRRSARRSTASPRHRIAATEERRAAHDAPPGAEQDPASRGGGDPDRGDHVSVARLRAASDLVARASRGRRSRPSSTPGSR